MTTGMQVRITGWTVGAILLIAMVNQSEAQQQQDPAFPGEGKSNIRIHKKSPMDAQSHLDQAKQDVHLEGFAPAARLEAQRLILKYGQPDEVTKHAITWHNKGPWKRTVVKNVEVPHDFPKPHVDFLAQTINMKVPVDKIDDLSALDGSISVNRTAGELTVMCDKEAANFLVVNLSHDIINEGKSVEEARQELAETIEKLALGEEPSIAQSLAFQVPSGDVGDPDKPMIAGAAERQDSVRLAGDRPRGGDTGSTGDAEALGFLIAINESEIQAAADAKKKKNASPQVLGFADMMHKEHGDNLQKTMQLGEEIGVTPLKTPAVKKLKDESAEGLAQILPLEGDAFNAAYLNLMVKEHQKARDLIEQQLLRQAQDEQLNNHLKQTREHIVHHLEEAQRLQGSVRP